MSVTTPALSTSRYLEHGTWIVWILSLCLLCRCNPTVATHVILRFLDGNANIFYSELADDMVPRAFVGAQADLLFVKAYGQLNIGFGGGLLGFANRRIMPVAVPEGLLECFRLALDEYYGEGSCARSNSRRFCLKLAHTPKAKRNRKK